MTKNNLQKQSKKTKNMSTRNKKELRDVLCPHCGKSLLTSSNVLLKNEAGIPYKRAIHFVMIASSNRKAVLQLSPYIGDYSKYSSVSLCAEEEVNLLCSQCHKVLNKDGLVRLLIQKEENDGVSEVFISPKNNVEATIFKSGNKIYSFCNGEMFKDIAHYMEEQIGKIKSR